MRQWAADSFVKEDEHRRDPDALVGEAIAVPAPFAFDQPMSLHLPQVVPQLREGVTLAGQSECGQHSGMDLGGAPAGELGARVEQDLHQSDHPSVVHLDAWDSGATDGHRSCEALEQRNSTCTFSDVASKP